MNIEGFMRHERYPQGYGIFEQGDGKPMTPAEALAFLQIEKAKGRKVIPVSGTCRNPCTHADKGCAGFDYSGGGCPGYTISDPSEAEQQT